MLRLMLALTSYAAVAGFAVRAEPPASPVVIHAVLNTCHGELDRLNQASSDLFQLAETAEDLKGRCKTAALQMARLNAPLPCRDASLWGGRAASAVMDTSNDPGLGGLEQILLVEARASANCDAAIGHSGADRILSRRLELRGLEGA